MTSTRSPLVDGSNPFLATKHKLAHHRLMPDIADYMSTEEAAKILGLHIETVRLFLRYKKLEGLKVGRSWLVSKASVNVYQTNNSDKEKHDPGRQSTN